MKDLIFLFVIIIFASSCSREQISYCKNDKDKFRGYTEKINRQIDLVNYGQKVVKNISSFFCKIPALCSKDKISKLIWSAALGVTFTYFFLIPSFVEDAIHSYDIILPSDKSNHFQETTYAIDIGNCDELSRAMMLSYNIAHTGNDNYPINIFWYDRNLELFPSEYTKYEQFFTEMEGYITSTVDFKNQIYLTTYIEDIKINMNTTNRYLWKEKHKPTMVLKEKDRFERLIYIDYNSYLMNSLNQIIDITKTYEGYIYDYYTNRIDEEFMILHTSNFVSDEILTEPLFMKKNIGHFAKIEADREKFIQIAGIKRNIGLSIGLDQRYYSSIEMYNGQNINESLVWNYKGSFDPFKIYKYNKKKNMIKINKKELKKIKKEVGVQKKQLIKNLLKIWLHEYSNVANQINLIYHKCKSTFKSYFNFEDLPTPRKEVYMNPN